MNTQKRLLVALFFLFAVILVGMTGLRIIDSGYSFIDSLYMTVITIFGIGYREIREPISITAKLFIASMIIVGVGTIALTTASLTAFILEGQLAQIFRRQKMQKEIDRMKKHYIICGAGATGHYVADELKKMRTDFVVIDKCDENISKIKHDSQDFPCVLGDATEDAILIKAGIERASGIISALPEDKDNVFVAITARGLNKNIRIVAKAVEEETTKKLLKVGADSVVSPTAIGGLRMASIMLRPNVVSFLDTMMRDADMTLRVEEAIIEDGSSFTGKSIAEVDIGKKTGAIIVSIKDGATGKQKFNPPSTTILKANDVLILIGSIEQVQLLKQLASKEGLIITSPDNNMTNT